jgi:branched-chain amino acid transport system substrate-binding protein
MNVETHKDEGLMRRRLSRRRFLQATGVSGAALSLSGLLAACKSSSGGGNSAAETTLKIGYVSPTTGSLAPFGEADGFILGGIRDQFAKGMTVAGKSANIQIITKDSQSDPNRAAQVASDLITSDKIDLMVVASTPETTNPVSGQCEANGVPCISTVAPWQPWFLGQQKDPANPVPFKYAYHFFWGLEDIEQVFFDMWQTIDTNKKVGGLFPNDGDGNAWGDKTLGLPSFFGPKGYAILDPGRYEDGTQDFSAQISKFKTAGVQILTGVPIPPDFTNFWKQANQQGFTPKIASVGKALLFPSSVDALGDIGEGMSTEYWWGPTHPFTSSLTGQSAQALADGYSTATNKQWTQPIGFVHALFELAADVLKRTSEVSPTAIVDAIKTTNLNTVVGPIQWTGQPFPNVAKTKLCGAQWKKGTKYPFELTVVSNGALPTVPIAGTLEPVPGS